MEMPAIVIMSASSIAFDMNRLRFVLLTFHLNQELLLAPAMMIL